MNGAKVKEETDALRKLAIYTDGLKAAAKESAENVERS